MSDETLRTLINQLPAILAGIVALVTLFRVQRDVRKIELATNSMKDALIDKTDKASRAEGELKGAQDERDRAAAITEVDK